MDNKFTKDFVNSEALKKQKEEGVAKNLVVPLKIDEKGNSQDNDL